MREVVEQILDGTYDYEKGALDFSCTKLEITLQRGELYEGSFKIFATEGKYTIGHITTSDYRMECLTPEFVGNEEEIYFRYHGEWMEEGEVTKGEFLVVSNKGEYYLPYVVSVEHTVPQSSIGPVKNLFHFTNLAQSNWKEAVRFYYSPAFPYVLNNSDKQVSLVYQGLSSFEGNEQNVEEFLIAMNKKQKVEYIVAEDYLKLNNPQGMMEMTLNLIRNGWGYTYLEVWAEGDFLFLNKNIITEEDFLGNRYSLPVYVDATQLHAGKNLGVVKFQNAYTVFEVPVEVTYGRVDSLEHDFYLEMEQNISRLMELYQEFRLKKVNKAAWMKEITGLIDRMLVLDDRNPAVRLFQAHLLITKAQYHEAGWVLEHVGELMGNEAAPALEAYYLYLNTLLKEEEGYTGEISWQVTKIYKDYGEDWRVAWLLLFLAGEYGRNPASKWSFLEHQFLNGCTSPLIYMEALQAFNMNPTLMRRLGAFELQVLNYGRKKAGFSAEAVEQILYLCERVREFQPLLFQVLVSCYERNKDIRVLKEICVQLIKGNKIEKKYAVWFVKGVEAELRITNLYEYYMLAIDLDEEPEIPKRVLLYFTYQTNLHYAPNAYLLYYIVKNQAKYPDIYENYRPRIASFVEEQLVKGRMNRQLAYLYKLYLQETAIDERMARALTRLLFACEIRLEREGIRNIIVCQQGNLKEITYPVVGGYLWVPMYGEESQLVFETQQGSRLVKDVPHTVNRLMHATDMVGQVASFMGNNPAFDIYVQEVFGDVAEVGATELARFHRMLEYPNVPSKTKGELVLKIADYYYHTDDKRHLVEYMNGLSGEGLSNVQRAELIRYMVLCDQFERAYEWIAAYGDEAADEKIMLRLAEVMLEKYNFAYEPVLTGLCYRLFAKGRYSSTTLQYLMQYYQGMTRNLRRIWKASKGYSIDRHAFSERVLIQILFSGYFVGEQAVIFEEYVSNYPDRQVEEAYLVKNSYEYFVNDRLIQKEVLVEIGRLYDGGFELQEICMLAYLKYYAENQEEILKEDTHIIGAFLDRMLQTGMRLGCFMELKQYSSNAMVLADKTIIEYHTAPGKNPKIHYLILKENGDAGDYLTETMEAVMTGVYCKEFVLFFGESLQYYIMEENGDEEKLTQSGTRQRSENHEAEGTGRYGAINDIVISKSLQDYNTFDSLLEEYYKREFYNQELFKLRR